MSLKAGWIGRAKGPDSYSLPMSVPTCWRTRRSCVVTAINARRLMLIYAIWALIRLYDRAKWGQGSHGG